MPPVGKERLIRLMTTTIARASLATKALQLDELADRCHRGSGRLIDAKLSDPDRLTLLGRRRDGGVSVEVVTSKRVGELKSHEKIMLIDERDAIVKIEQLFGACETVETGAHSPAASG